MKETQLNQNTINEICDRIKTGERVLRTLPGGSIRIDHQLPFLCIYRQPKNDESLTVKLIRSEASYIIMPTKKSKSIYCSLIEQIVETMSDVFKTFLLFEIWEGKANQSESLAELNEPIFNLYADTNGELISTCEIFASCLENNKALKMPVRPQINYTRITRPKGLSPLLPKSTLMALNCFSLGLQIEPIYRNPKTQEYFPIVFRALHRGFSRAVKQAFFEFSRSNTAHRPKNYHTLGQKSITKSVYEIDHQLASIDSMYDFLFLVTPTNIDQSWNTFKRNGFQKQPIFQYRPLPIDPALLKRKLYQINIEKISDPTLGYLFRKKRDEMDRELTMLNDRNTKNFLLGSIQLYGAVDKNLMDIALDILDQLPGRISDDTFTGRHTAQEFADYAQKEIDHYKTLCQQELPSKVIISDEVVGMICSQGNLYVGQSVRLPNNRVEALMQHEIGTHILTYLNGSFQPLNLLVSGLDGYDELQEGLAVLAEYLVGQLSKSRIRLLAGRVVAAKYIEEGASFIETFKMLQRNHSFEQKTAYRIAVRIYRGGGLIKDAIYLRGLVRLLKYIESQGDIDLLFLGKFAFEHIPFITELLHRGILQAPKLTPSYMDKPLSLQRLNKLKQGLQPLQLIKSSI